MIRSRMIPCLLLLVTLPLPVLETGGRGSCRAAYSHQSWVDGGFGSAGVSPSLGLRHSLLDTHLYAQQIEPPSPNEPMADVEPEASAETAVETAAPEDLIALFYLRRCSGCHTIGRGDLDGPDLIDSTKWPRDDLRAAVQRMEKNVGAMTGEQVEGLVDLLKSDDLQQRLDEAASRRVAEMAAKLDPGSPDVGERLFFGSTALENGGIACFACHAVDGRGGNLAVDLTKAHERLGESSLLSATEEPSFPLMKAAYGGRPVTTQEAVHVAAYLAAASDGAVSGETSARRESLPMLHGVAGGIVLLSLGGIAFAARSRRAGVRSRLVRESFRR